MKMQSQTHNQTRRASASLLLLLAALLTFAGNSFATTIAHWTFEDGVDGQPFNPISQPNGSTGSVDVVSSTLMRGWDPTAGASFTAATYGTGLGANFNAAQDGYVTEGALHNWGPTNWTVETMIYLRSIAGWNTIIGRDGSTVGGAGSDLYLQNNGIDDRFRIDYLAADGTRRQLDGTYAPQVNTWYALAVVNDGATLSMWLDDGTGYAQIGTLDMSAQTPEANALTNSVLNWTFGRGWYNGGLVDRIDGKMDNVRFSDVALTSTEFLQFPTNVFVLSGPTPASQTVALGNPFSFSIVAGGVSPTYQWRHAGTNLPGETSPTYSVAVSSSIHLGNYDCVLANGFSSVTSSVAVLSLHVPRPLVWGGVAGGWDTTSANWTTNAGGSFLAYIETDNVRFSPFGVAQPVVTLNAAHAPSSIVVSNASYTFAGSNITSGALSLENNASLTLSNVNSFASSTVSSGTLHLRTANNNLGALSIANGGVVQLHGNSQTAARLSGAGLINSTSGAPVLTFGSDNANATWSGSITNEGGSPSFIKVGAGTNTFSGQNYLAGAAASQVNGGGLIIPTGGAIVPNGTAEFWVGQGATTGYVEVSGGSLSASNWFVIGRANAAANGTFVLNSGTVSKQGGGNVVIGSLGATGRLIVNGGQFLNNANLWLGENAGANAWLYLNGGLVQATQVRVNGTGILTSYAYFNGGTLQATAASADFLPTPTIGIIQAGGLVFDNNGNDITITSMLVEDNLTPSTGGGLTKMGAGTLNLSGGYNHTGPTIVKAGTLALNPATAASSPDLVVSNASLSISSGTLNAGNVTLGNGAVLNLNYGDLLANPASPMIAASGNLTASGTTITINLQANGLVPGTIPLITYGGATLGSIANFVLGPLPPGVTANLVNAANSLNLNITAAGQNLSWYGDVNNVWNINSAANWANSLVPGAVYLEYGSVGDPVKFDDTAAGNYDINLTASVHPFTMLVNAANNYSITGAGGITGATAIVKTNTGTLVLGTVNTHTGGTIVGQGILTVTNATALGPVGGSVRLNGGTLQLAGNTTSSNAITTATASSIEVNPGVTANFIGTLSGAARLSKRGEGTLGISGTNTPTGSLSIVGGTVQITGGSTRFGAGPNYVGYLNGSPHLNLTGGSNFFAGDFRVGGSDTSGLGIMPTGTVTIANSTLSVGSLTIARGNNIQNSAVGTVTVNSGGTLNSEGDIVVDFAGDANNNAVLNLNAGGTVNLATTVTRWFIVSQWDLGDATVNINGGQLNLSANTALRFATGNNNGTNIVNLNSGAITFYSDNKTTVGGTGVVDLHQGGGSCTNIFNLNGGVLSTFGVVTVNNAGARAFNFNGGTLRAIGNNTAFFSVGTGSAVANVRNGGAIIDTVGFNVTNAAVLRHSTIPGDNAIDGGLTKLGAGTLTLSASNTYSGPTTISNGTLVISSPYLADAANVNIAASGKLQLNFVGTDVVNGLTIANVAQANGTYGATGSGAANIDDVHFAGTGVLQVGPPKPALGVTQTGNTLTFNWSGAYKLVAQTNALGVGLQSGAVWYDVPGGATTGVAITIDPAQPTVFFGLAPTP
jgi:autotransporter-associated beta strand protein